MNAFDKALLHEIARSVLHPLSKPIGTILPTSTKWSCCTPTVIAGGPLHPSVLIGCDGQPLAVTNDHGLVR